VSREAHVVEGVEVAVVVVVVTRFPKGKKKYQKWEEYSSSSCVPPFPVQSTSVK